MTRPRFLPDNFVLALIGAVTLASFLPCEGRAAETFDRLAAVAVSLLFFLQGAKLSGQAVLAGLLHWRLHLTVLACTFVLFPLFGVALRPVLAPFVGPELYLGVLFLCAVPSTVQSSIALTSVARGNVPAAVCSASMSNFAGIFVTPLVAGLLLSTQGGGQAPLDAVLRIAAQLLLPFVAGQLARPRIGAWVARQKLVVKAVDQGAILLVVYTAFSAAVVQGLWQQVSAGTLVSLLAADALLLALALLATVALSRRLRFRREDEIAMVFCGSKKSLASGVPLAKLLFAAPTVGAMILPLMLFHQMQLMVCALLASRYARRPDDGPGTR